MFGTTSSPCMVQFDKNHNAEEYNRHKTTAIEEHHYVDDEHLRRSGEMSTNSGVRSFQRWVRYPELGVQLGRISTGQSIQLGTNLEEVQQATNLFGPVQPVRNTGNLRDPWMNVDPGSLAQRQ